VVAPLLLLVAALTEFRIPQAVASSITGHPHWELTATLGLADLPMAAGAPG
jgi:sirohydrochlorin ferrochelatase